MADAAAPAELNDFYFGSDEFEFRWATSRWSASRRWRCSAARSRAKRGSACSWTLRDGFRDAVVFWLSTDDLPLPENRVTLARDGNIVISYSASNEVPKQRLCQQLKSMLASLGMHHDHLLPHHAYLKNEIPVAGVALQAGTCRFGTDPATSVLNACCRAHQLDNLYVDTSFFAGIGGVNPAHGDREQVARGRHLLPRMSTQDSRPETSRVG